MNKQLFKHLKISFEDGFSSEEQQQQKFTPSLRVSHLENQYYDSKLITPPIDIISKQYSLTPDISTGWAPKFQVPTPIPLYFQNQTLDISVNLYLENKSQYPQLKLCYVGPRFQSTYFAYLNQKFQFPYKIMQKINQPQCSKIKLIARDTVKNNNSILEFDSDFESGNLDYAFQIGDCSYELYIRVDSNTRGHFQWFNFKVRNMKKGQRYQFSIGNFQKNNLLYIKDAKPFVFSKKDWEINNIDWKQGGDDIKFGKISPKITQIVQSQQQEEQFIEKKYYHLSFSYLNEFQDDEVQFSYCIPYTYSNLLQRINELIQTNQHKKIIKNQKLCYSLGGLQIPVITITSNVQQQLLAKKKHKRLKKQIIMVSGRLHPGQSNGSFMVQGFISSLLSDNYWASMLRQAFIFKIVPMVNPDGVVLGNYRTGLSGKDLNRQFIDPDKEIFPEIVGLKQLVRQYKNLYGQKFFIYLDFHGHSLKKNIFMYGPDFAIMSKYYYECRVFPKIISEQTSMFRYHSCSFQLSKFKQSTIRGVLLKLFNFNFVYTIEASNGLFKDQQNSEDTRFDKKYWKEAGQKICLSLSKYYELIKRQEQEKRLKLQQKEIFNRKRYTDEQSHKKKKISYKNSKCKTSINFNKSKDKIQIPKNAGNFWRKQLLGIEENMTKIQINSDKNSEDQISQGFSDRQGSQNDFDQSKMQQLILKIKMKNRSKEELDRELKRREIEQRNKKCITQMQEIKNEDINCQIYPIMRKKNNYKKQIFIKKKFKDFGNDIFKKTEKNKAKIINFTFNLSKSYSQLYQTVDRQSKIFAKPSKIYDTQFINRRLTNTRTLQNRINPFKLTVSNSKYEIQKMKERTSLDHKTLYINNVKDKKQFI